MNKEVGFAKTSKSESATRIPPFCPHLTTILRQYLTFNLRDDSFGSSVKSEVVVLKKYHTPLESIELATGNDKGEVLNPKDVIKDIFAVHVRQSKDTDYIASGANLLVHQEQANQLTKLKKDYTHAIVKI